MMKKILTLKIATILAIVFASISVLSSCSKDKGETLAPITNTATIDATLASCDSLLSIATPNDYPQASITSYTQTVADGKTAKGLATTQYAIDNINYNLQAATVSFEGSAYGAIPAINLVAAWKFEEGTGTSLVSTGSDKWTAVLSGGPTQVFGAHPQLPTFTTRGKEKAISLDNGACLTVNDYQESPLLGNQLTISAWVKPNVTKDDNYILSLGYWNNWKLNIQGGAEPMFTLATATGITDTDNGTPQSVPSGSWTHVVLTMNLSDPTNAESYYINGVKVLTWTASQRGNLVGSQRALYVPSSGVRLPLLIGCPTTYDEVVAQWTWAPAPSKPSDWNYFSGSLDNIEIYDISLTDGQVAKLYNDEKE